MTLRYIFCLSTSSSSSTRRSAIAQTISAEDGGDNSIPHMCDLSSHGASNQRNTPTEWANAVEKSFAQNSCSRSLELVFDRDTGKLSEDSIHSSGQVSICPHRDEGWPYSRVSL